MGLLVFTRHPSGSSRDQSLPTTLECQVQESAVGLPEQRMHLMRPFYGITGHSEVVGVWRQLDAKRPSGVPGHRDVLSSSPASLAAHFLRVGNYGREL